MTDDLHLGQIIDSSRTPSPQRDAVHIAVAPVIAYRRLSPGQVIGFVNNSTEEVAYHMLGYVKSAVGIVDPFLGCDVEKGERFWMFLFPGSITSLRHDWTHPHPAFAKPVQSAPTTIIAQPGSGPEQWIQHYALSIGLSYLELMNAASAYLRTGDYICTGEYEERLPDEFWDYYEAVTDTKIRYSDRGSFFSCSC